MQSGAARPSASFCGILIVRIPITLCVWLVGFQVEKRPPIVIHLTATSIPHLNDEHV